LQGFLLIGERQHPYYNSVIHDLLELIVTETRSENTTEDMQVDEEFEIHQLPERRVIQLWNSTVTLKYQVRGWVALGLCSLCLKLYKLQ
jgi:hypothetical protein